MMRPEDAREMIIEVINARVKVGLPGAALVPESVEAAADAIVEGLKAGGKEAA